MLYQLTNDGNAYRISYPSYIAAVADAISAIAPSNLRVVTIAKIRLGGGL